MRMRMLNPDLWNDADVGSLTIPARLLFIGLISHADDEGRGVADPRQLRKQVFGFDEVKSDEVEGWLNEIGERIRNVNFYSVDGKEYYYLTKWLRYQKISHPSPSSLPVPPNSDPSASQAGPSDTPNIFRAYESNIGPLTPMIADELKEAEKAYPIQYVMDAFAEAVTYNKRNWKYCKSILERWMVEGKADNRPAKVNGAGGKQAGNKSAIASVLKVN